MTFFSMCIKVHLDCLAIYVKDCRNDNRWLWQSGLPCEEKKIIIPQPGSEPGTSWLSFRCSTNWATKEYMLLSSPQGGHSPVTIYMLCTICLLQAGDLDLWFEGLPPCIKVHLDCLAIYVKDCHNDNRWLWQSGLPCEEKKIIIPQPGSEPGTSWLSFRCSTNWATKEYMLLSSPQGGHSPVTIYMLCTICLLQAGDLDLWFEGLPPCIKVHLDCLAIYVKDCRNDNRWLWQSGLPCEEKKIIIPQLGSEPGTSWLSFRCSTNWATKEYMLLSSPQGGHSPVTIYMLCTICLLQAGDLDLWFEGLPPCIKVHLDCLAIYVKDCRNDNRWLWQSGLPCEEKKIIIPQPGSEPGTSWLSFRCSTNWATKEYMLLSSPQGGHSPVTIYMLCTICLLQAGDLDLWFEGLPPCIKVHLDCLAIYVKDCCNDNRWLWQSGLPCEEKKIIIPQPGSEPGTSWLSFRL